MHMNKWFPIWTILGLLIFVLPCWGFELTLLHVNDSHSYLDATDVKLTPGGVPTYAKLGAWARLQTAVDSIRSNVPNVALLHAGDAVQGDLYFMKYGGKPEMEFLNRLGFDAMTLGNHEFDKGSDFLAGFLEYAKIPIVSANINASGKPKLAARLKPYTILSFGREQVGIIGLTIKDTSFISSPGPGVDFMNEAETAKKYVKELQDQGVEKIVLLTHVGLDNDKVLAATVPGVDVIVGGHSHSLIADPVAMKAMGEDVDDTYPVRVKGPDGSDVYVVTAWKWGRVLGRLDLTFDAVGRVVSAHGSPMLLVADGFKQKNEAGEKIVLQGAAQEEIRRAIEASPVAEIFVEDKASVVFLKPYSKGVQAMRNDVIGVATKPLTHIRVPGVTREGLSLPKGSLLAPIVCQSMLSKIDATGKRADIALQNAGGIRESIEQGNISIGTAYAVLPFNNSLYVLKMTGSVIASVLECGVTKGGGAFPYVAGARYTADMTKPVGSRVTHVDVLTKDGKWQPLDATQTYSVVTNAYLAGGGDGYAMLKSIRNRYDTGFVDALAFIEYVEKENKISPPVSTGVTYISAE